VRRRRFASVDDRHEAELGRRLVDQAIDHVKTHGPSDVAPSPSAALTSGPETLPSVTDPSAPAASVTGVESDGGGFCAKSP